MQTHELKIWPGFLAAIESGEKTFEIRRDDRRFRPGDTLRLREWIPNSKEYTGKQIEVQVIYILCDPFFGLQPGFVCMSIRRSDGQSVREETK